MSEELTPDQREKLDRERDRRWIFTLQLLYLAGLGVVAGLYFHGDLKVRNHYFGHVPPGVFWFGALGAVLISLTGVFEHSDTWDSGWDYWHIGRPVVGATVGLISVLIFQAGILAAGSNPTPSGSSGTLSDAPKNITYYLVAFLVGYREETFRHLIRRLTDVLLSPDGVTKPVKPTLSLLNPSTGTSAGATTVVMLGTGLTGAKSVKFGANNATFTVDSDAQITAVTPASSVTGPVAVAVTTGAGEGTGQQFTYS